MVKNENIKLIYKFLGLAFIGAALIIFMAQPDIIFDIPLMLSGQDPYGLVLSCGLIALLFIGILNLLFGFGKFKINKLSNISAILGLSAVFVAIVPSILIVVLVFMLQTDAICLVAIFIPAMLAGLMAITSVILLVAAMFVR